MIVVPTSHSPAQIKLYTTHIKNSKRPSKLSLPPSELDAEEDPAAPRAGTNGLTRELVVGPVMSMSIKERDQENEDDGLTGWLSNGRPVSTSVGLVEEPVFAPIPSKISPLSVAAVEAADWVWVMTTVVVELKALAWPVIARRSNGTTWTVESRVMARFAGAGQGGS
jgi:hypothetical protein